MSGSQKGNRAALQPEEKRRKGLGRALISVHCKENYFPEVGFLCLLQAGSIVRMFTRLN